MRATPTRMVIAFTGHRDGRVGELWLHEIAAWFPGALWIHGGADGFDSQVDEYAFRMGIQSQVLRPDYKTHPPKIAPLIRNRALVAQADFLVACWDGRLSGGTFFTVEEARRKGIAMLILPPAKEEP